MYKMNYHTDIVNFLGGGAYLKNLTFRRGTYWRGALIRSFTVLMIISIRPGTMLL